MAQQAIKARQGITKPKSKRILHVGCGSEDLPDWLEGQDVRLDIDPSVMPDIVASMTNLGDIGSFDAIYCSHALEHLYPYDVPVALAEFLRVLRPGGVAIIFVPDLEGVEPTDEILYKSPAGFITGFDLIYGYRPFLKEQPYMAHHTGFTARMLHMALITAGFEQVRTERQPGWNLLGWGQKPA